MESFEQFLKDLKDDKLEPYLKSEPIPETNDGPVKVAVGKNFDEIITDNGKDTLIEFYAPWCGHCKKLTPVYEEVGEKVSLFLCNNELSVVIICMYTILRRGWEDNKISLYEYQVR